MKQETFDNIEQPFILKSTLSTSNFDDWINGLRSGDNRKFVAVLRGERMKDMNSFLQEIAAALQFPHYFGNNWNALDECIKDLSWIPANTFVIGISNSESILSQCSAEDRQAFGELIRETCESWSQPYDEDKEWGRPGRPFHIVMQCQDEKQLAKFGDIFKSN